jgi:thiol-disulfide isomerase/thioredoxin
LVNSFPKAASAYKCKEVNVIGSRRTLLTAFAGLAATAIAAPGFAGDGSLPVQFAGSRAAAPNFVGISRWFNSAPLSISDLRGKVVLVDFWTYGCYNCVNTLPYVTKLYESYKDKGLVVVGIHTPEFPFERSAGNVQAALKRHGITYPVAQDNDSATWNAWRNQYWPAQYIVDQHGNIVFSHAGEGQYDVIERTVRRLLNATS